MPNSKCLWVCLAGPSLAQSRRRRGVKMICQRATPSAIKRKQLECIYVSATVSGHLPRTSWPTACTWFFMKLHIKNDGIPAARPGRCFACLMTTKTKPKNEQKKTAQKTTNCCAGAGLAKSLYLLLFLSVSLSHLQLAFVGSASSSTHQ